MHNVKKVGVGVFSSRLQMHDKKYITHEGRLQYNINQISMKKQTEDCKMYSTDISVQK